MVSPISSSDCWSGGTGDLALVGTDFFLEPLVLDEEVALIDLVSSSFLDDEPFLLSRENIER